MDTSQRKKRTSSSNNKTSKRSSSKIDSQETTTLTSKRKRTSKEEQTPVPKRVPKKSKTECKETPIQTKNGAVTTIPELMNSTQRITHVSLCCDSASNCMHATCKKDHAIDNRANTNNGLDNNNNNNGKNENDNTTKDSKNNTINNLQTKIPQNQVRSHAPQESPRQVASGAVGCKPVQVEHQTFYVDPEIFSQGSEFFNMAWKGSGMYMKEKDGPLVLEETSISLFKNMEEYFVTGKIQSLEQTFSMDVIMEILEGATQYLCPKLTVYCSTILFKELEANPPSKAILQPLLEFAEFNEIFAEHIKTFLKNPKSYELDYQPYLAFKLFQSVPLSTSETPQAFVNRILPFLKLSRRIERLASLFVEDESIVHKDFAFIEALIANTHLKSQTRLKLLLKWKQQQLVSEPQFEYLLEKYVKLHAIPLDYFPDYLIAHYGLDKPVSIPYYAQWAMMTFSEIPSVCSGRHKVRTILTCWLWHVIAEDKRFGSYLLRIRLWFRTITLFDQFLIQKSKYLLGRQSLVLNKLQCVGLSCLRFVCRQIQIKVPIKDCEKYTQGAYTYEEFLETYHEIQETVVTHKIDTSQNALECSGMIEPLQLGVPVPNANIEFRKRLHEMKSHLEDPNKPKEEKPEKPPRAMTMWDWDGINIAPPPFAAIRYAIALWGIHMMSWNTSNRNPNHLGVAGAKAVSVLQIPEVETMAVHLRDLLNQLAMEQKYCLLELLDFMKLRTPDFAHVTRDFEEYEEFSVWWKHFGNFVRLKKNTVFTFYHNSEQKSPVLSIQI